MDQIEMLTTDRHITSVERAVAGIPMHNNSELFSNAQSTFDFYDETQEKDEISISNTSQELKRSIFGIPSGILRIFLSSTFICTMMAIGIIIVCLTAPKPKVLTCGLNFVRTGTNPIEYNYGPVSVAIGDFNLDTWIDMVIVNSIVSRIGVYFGNSNGTFVKEYEYS
ncbi:unnamed protein product, partial [Adineta ricciae]